MYKIRLYVVPEQEETVEELASEGEEDDRPSAMLQRRNSRRPGAVRVNVLQKDRRVEMVQMKPRQNSVKRDLPIALCDVQSGQRPGKNVVSQKENQERGATGLARREGPRLPPRNVFASPKIKQLALDLQEKMMERNAKIRGSSFQLSKQTGVRAKIVPGKIHGLESQKDLPPLSALTADNDDDNNNNNNNGNRPPKENLARPNREKNFDGQGNESIGGKFEFTNVRRKSDGKEIFVVDHDRLLPRNSSAGSTNKRGACEYLENRTEIVVLGINCQTSDRFEGRSPKIVRVKADEEPDDVDEDVLDGDVTSVAKDNDERTETVVLRRNNKLNGYREYDLEQKIEVEIKMREGSARLLAAARHRAQSLEAARALLTSNERMSAYMAELQRRKREPSNKTSAPGSTARVSLSELRVPLMWRDSDHFKNRGDYRRFAVFCLARVGTEIHDTALLCPVDRALTDISFPDVLVFNNVPAEFELTLEIYSHILQEDLSIASTPRRIKRTIHSSISKTVGKKLAASLRDELNSGKIGPHFELMASARLTLDDTDDNIHTHDLVINSLEHKHHSLPLFGHFCCRLAAQPECISKEVCSGNISLNGRNYWARLQGFSIQTWESRKLADEEQNSIHTIPINRETSIHPSKSSSKELRIMNSVDGSERVTTIRLESNEDAQRWLRQLVAHAKDHLRWKRAAESIQEVPCVESARNSFISNKRQGSLYDETPLIESVQTDYSSTRPTVQEIFGLTPSTSLSSCSSTNSPPSLRSRSLSTSGPRKLSASALKAHWPFSNKNHD